jgi:predicted nuclease with TOPRIM domain
MNTAIEIKVNDVKESVVIASNKLTTEDHINVYLDTICKFRNIILDCKEKLSSLNTTLYDELFNHKELYLELKSNLKELRNALIRLTTQIKKNNHIYTGVKTATKELSNEINLFNEIIGDLELKNEVLPANKNITGILSSIE